MTLRVLSFAAVLRLRAWLRRLSWKLRKVRRLECWWRQGHHGFWFQGVWVCRRCAKQLFGPPPAGTLITDEPAKHIYRVEGDGSLRRLDKVRGGKKARRKKKDERERVERMRRHLLGDQGEAR